MSAPVAMRKAPGVGVKLVSKTYCRIEAQAPRELWPVDWVKMSLPTSERSRISLSPNRQTQTHFRWGFDVSDPVQANQKFSRMTRRSKPNFLQGYIYCSYALHCAGFYLSTEQSKRFPFRKTTTTQHFPESQGTLSSLYLQTFLTPALKTQPRHPAPESVQASRQVQLDPEVVKPRLCKEIGP